MSVKFGRLKLKVQFLVTFTRRRLDFHVTLRSQADGVADDRVQVSVRDLDFSQSMAGQERLGQDQLKSVLKNRRGVVLIGYGDFNLKKTTRALKV
jgi:hypothetical protein